MKTLFKICIVITTIISLQQLKSYGQSSVVPNLGVAGIWNISGDITSR